MTDAEIIDFATKFRRGMIGRRKSRGMCWCVCNPLQVVLTMMGARVDLIEGTLGGEFHFWLSLPDGTVIDPTADQFAKLGLPWVYVGRPGRLYRKRRNWSQKLGKCHPGTVVPKSSGLVKITSVA